MGAALYPIPVKYAASLMGLCRSDMRLPLTLPSNESQEKIKQALKNLELI